ncbi:MAG: divergent PAP2 family protein [Oscillospiraceae bacterium]|jgi:acid phosphatase family membrane protein YuiD|nr:divergent PAP2 family protein [Oscillospiraceae bacterium]
MNYLRDITGNYIMNVGVVAFFGAQVCKVFFTLLMTRRIVPERLIGAGGMPSSHSALTSSIVIAIQKKVGFSSPEFGLAIALAAIVMYDAMGVRRAAGEQAKVLNKMIFEFPFFKQKKDMNGDGVVEEHEEEPLIPRELKEFLGHTPIEVLGGCLLGILVAMFMPVV